MRYVVGEPIPPELLTAAGINGFLDTIDELRAVLEPLLDQPYQPGGPYFAPHQECRFCRSILGDERHLPTCPVLKRDALLGR